MLNFLFFTFMMCNFACAMEKPQQLNLADLPADIHHCILMGLLDSSNESDAANNIRAYAITGKKINVAFKKSNHLAFMQQLVWNFDIGFLRAAVFLDSAQTREIIRKKIKSDRTFHKHIQDDLINKLSTLSEKDYIHHLFHFALHCGANLDVFGINGNSVLDRLINEYKPNCMIIHLLKSGVPKTIKKNDLLCRYFLTRNRRANPQVISLFLKCGANAQGFNALHSAVLMGTFDNQDDCVSYCAKLLNYGADPLRTERYQETDKVMTPLQLANRLNKHKIVELFKNHIKEHESKNIQTKTA